MPKLTKRHVDLLKPSVGGSDVFAWDSELRGFGVRMKASGSAAYLVQYRNAERRTRRLVIGKVGTLTPEEARSIARDRLAEVARGGDPSETRRASRTAVTVAQLCSDYLAACRKGEKLGRRGLPMKPSTIEGDRLRMDVHVIPLIGSRSVAALTADDIRKLKTDIAAGKTGRPRGSGRGGVRTGGRGTASRVLGMLGPLFEYGKSLGMLKDNPARGVPKYADQKRDRFLSAEEIERIGAALSALEKNGGPLASLAAIRLLMLTGMRRTEALGLPWAWVDSQAQCIRFGDTKTGAQLRAIGTPAVRLLAHLPRSGSKWVFPAERGSGHYIGLPKVLKRVCAAAGVEGVTAHVLRHTFASVAAELNFSELTIAGLLGHSVPGVTARYAHVPDSALVTAADRVSAHIAAALAGKLATAKVVPLTRSA